MVDVFLYKTLLFLQDFLWFKDFFRKTFGVLSFRCNLCFLLAFLFFSGHVHLSPDDLPLLFHTTSSDETHHPASFVDCCESLHALATGISRRVDGWLRDGGKACRF